MKSVKVLLIAVAAITSVLSPSGAGAKGSGEVIVSGDRLQALGTALSDFSKVLKSRRRQLREYEVHLRKEGDSLKVSFELASDSETGGGVMYELRPPYRKIHQRVFYK